MQTIKQFAMSLGTAARKARGESLTYAVEYHSADKDAKASMKADWMIGHVAGFLNVTLEQADKIVQRGKGAGAKSENVRAIDRAYSDFRFHILTNGVEAKVAKAEAPLAIPPEVLKAAKALMAICDQYKGAVTLAKAAVTEAAK